MNDEFLPGEWEVPGGGIEVDESPIEGLRREIKEECGLDVKVVPEPLAMGEYLIEKTDEKVYRIEFTFKCEWDGTGNVKLSEEHDEFAWVSPTQFSGLEMTGYMHRLVTNSLDRLMGNLF